MSSERKVPRVACQLKFNQADVCVCMSGRAPIQSGRCWFVCLDEPQYNQADGCLYVRTCSNTIRQMSVCLSGRAPIQSGRRGFESLAGSVLDEAQYNQAYEVKNELHTIKQGRYIIAVAYAVKSGGYIHVLVMKQKHFYVIK